MSTQQFLSRQQLDPLFKRLQEEGYRLLGPQVEQDSLLYQPLESAAQLPWGVRDQQQPGHYRLQNGDNERAFAWANGPQAIKPLLFSPQESLWQVEQTPHGLQFKETLPTPEKIAIIGVRACDLAAMAIQDQHFFHGIEADRHYARRRENLFVIAVNCSHPASTCFCAATGDGPVAESGFDLLLDEVDGGFVTTFGSEAVAALLEGIMLEPASSQQLQQLDKQRSDAAKQQRSMPAKNMHGLLAKAAESPRWQVIAERCLACGNCTAVCPTCFCHSEHDAPQLGGGSSEHYRQWDSCFSADHSLVHGHAVRAETAHRYRQWLTHKFDNWHEQYGRAGCVGCGRCISWCPVGIDVTEELQHLCGGDA